MVLNGHMARLARQLLAATAAPFAHSIDGRLTHDDLQAGHAALATSRRALRWGDGEGQGECVDPPLRGHDETDANQFGYADQAGIGLWTLPSTAIDRRMNKWFRVTR
jgi:hypothetical protein